MSERTELLKQIEEQLTQLPDFGQLQIHIKRHLGNFSNTDMVKMTSHRYAATDKESANTDCAADIFSLMKNIQNADLDGSLSFSITFKKGKAETMGVQDFKKL